MAHGFGDLVRVARTYRVRSNCGEAMNDENAATWKNSALVRVAGTCGVRSNRGSAVTMQKGYVKMERDLDASPA